LDGGTEYWDQACFHIRIQFEQEFKGLEGTKRVDTLPLFSRVEFLGPHRGIKTILERSAAYVCRQEPMQINDLEACPHQKP